MLLWEGADWTNMGKLVDTAAAPKQRKLTYLQCAKITAGEIRIAQGQPIQVILVQKKYKKKLI